MKKYTSNSSKISRNRKRYQTLQDTTNENEKMNNFARNVAAVYLKR